jgi:hypothetical protein
MFKPCVAQHRPPRNVINESTDTVSGVVGKCLTSPELQWRGRQIENPRCINRLIFPQKKPMRAASLDATAIVARHIQISFSLRQRRR